MAVSGAWEGCARDWFAARFPGKPVNYNVLMEATERPARSRHKGWRRRRRRASGLQPDGRVAVPGRGGGRSSRAHGLECGSRGRCGSVLGGRQGTVLDAIVSVAVSSRGRWRRRHLGLRDFLWGLEPMWSRA